MQIMSAVEMPVQEVDEALDSAHQLDQFGYIVLLLL